MSGGRFGQPIVAVAVLFVLLVAQSVGMYRLDQLLTAVHDQAVANHTIAEQNRRISQAIASCATANGACSRRGEANRAKAVASVTQVTLAAVTCAKKPELNTYPEIRACVTAAIARQPH
jgi:uncharacterized membrane protein